MVVKYAQNELFSITEMAKMMGNLVTSIRDNSIEKIGILKNNKLQAVLISTQEYEKLKRIEEIFEDIEDEEIYQVIKSREDTPLSEYISFEELSKEFNG